MPQKSMQPTFIPGTGHDICLMCDLLSTVIIRFVSSLNVFDSTDLASFIEYFAKRKRKKTVSEEDWFSPSLPFPRRY